MDILIEAPGHKHLEEVEKHFSNILNQKFGKYPFINNISLKICDEPHKMKKISLLLSPKNDKAMFSSDINRTESLAFQEVLRKIKVQIEKYKQVHYNKN